MQIENCLTNEGHALTVVVADGGMGKTALVNEVGHTLAKKGTSVVYFSLRGLHTVEECARQFLELFDLRPGESPEKEVINLAHELKEETVLIVDNIHHLMESSVPYFRKEKNILTFISEIAASQDKVKILATSRRKVNSAEWRNFTLHPLSKEKATELLQILNRSLEAEEANYRATLSSGSPLHLIILASIKTPIGVIGRQSVPELPEILAVWFEELGDLKNIALKLTVFPAKFTLKEVNEILYPTENAENLGKRIDELTDSCLLTKNEDCYAIHSSIKSFLEGDATKTNGRKEVVQDARKEFIDFQISKLHEMYKQFLSPDPQPAITKFNNAKRHIVEAFRKAIQGWGLIADGLKEKCIDSANKTIEFLSKVMGRTELEDLLRLFADYCQCQKDQRRFSECYTSIGVKIINDYQSLGDMKKAEALFREALNIRRRHLGESHQETARSYYDLGKCLAKKKDYQEALVMLRKALEIQQWVGDIPHEEFITSQEILSILEIQGKGEEVKTMEEQLKACSRRVRKLSDS